MNIEKNKDKIAKVAVMRSLKLVLLYGSQVSKTKNINSDIDIAVLGNKEISFDNIVQLNNDFIDIFKINEIDVKSLHNVDPFFRHQVMSNSILLFGKEYDYNSFRAYSFRDYCDSKSLLKLKTIIINKRVEDLKTV